MENINSACHGIFTVILVILMVFEHSKGAVRGLVSASILTLFIWLASMLQWHLYLSYLFGQLAMIIALIYMFSHML